MKSAKIWRFARSYPFSQIRSQMVRMCLYSYWIRKVAIWSYIISCIVPHIRFEKAEGAMIPQFCMSSCTLALHRMFHQISLCYYLLVQLPPLDELYEERNQNAHAGANSGHQLLLSNFTECLGTCLCNTLFISLSSSLVYMVLPG